MSDKILVSYSMLKLRYVTKRESSAAIAAEYGIDRSTVIRKLRAMGVDLRGNKPYASDKAKAQYWFDKATPMDTGFATDCLMHAGYVDPKGYGRIGRLDASRFVYKQLRKPDLPSSVKLVHKCLIGCCINPDHVMEMQLKPLEAENARLKQLLADNGLKA